ncbi:hypothetical protein ACLJYM_00075 [Rhizobium giardinii]|uniref:hypothetical protein n=1 Tax=Rhizobium giardinii TaxID=56731 RepID=UPI0039E0BBAF
MRQATWNAIEGNPAVMRIYRSYRQLPEEVRAPARWLVAPLWHTACALVRRRATDAVLSGPFQGMKLLLSPVSSRHLLGYLLGTQELELHPIVETVIRQNYGTVINVGVADGYYAIGFARRMPSTRIVGFEGLPEHHEPFWQTARMNGVADRIRVEGFCDTADLQNALAAAGPRPFVLCDIEGGEKALLDNSRIPELNQADILVETHDGLVPGCTSLLLERFGKTHDITSIYARPRSARDFPSDKLPFLAKWMPRTAVELMNERRTGVQEWLFMTARSGPGRDTSP